MNAAREWTLGVGLALGLTAWFGVASTQAGSQLKWKADGQQFRLEVPNGWTVAPETGQSLKPIPGLEMTILANLKEPLRQAGDDYTESLTLAKLGGSAYRRELADKSLREIIEVMGPGMGWGANIYAPSSLAKPKWIKIDGTDFCRFDQHTQFSHGPAQARYYVCKGKTELYWFCVWSRPNDAARHQKQCDPLIRKLLLQVQPNGTRD